MAGDETPQYYSLWKKLMRSPSLRDQTGGESDINSYAAECYYYFLKAFHVALSSALIAITEGWNGRVQ